MKPFDPTKPVRTRNGQKARIIATDFVSHADRYPIVALVRADVGDVETILTYTKDGRKLHDHEFDLSDDLVNILETKVELVIYYCAATDSFYATRNRILWPDLRYVEVGITTVETPT